VGTVRNMCCSARLALHFRNMSNQNKRRCHVITLAEKLKMLQYVEANPKTKKVLPKKQCKYIHSMCVRRNFSRGVTSTFCLWLLGFWQCTANGRSQNALKVISPNFQGDKFQFCSCGRPWYSQTISINLRYLFKEFYQHWVDKVFS